MKRNLIILLTILLNLQFMVAQDYEQQSLVYKNNLSDEYKNGEKSPLSGIDKINFRALKFYDFNPDLVVKARFERIKNKEEVILATSTTRKPTYMKYGYLYFNFEGKEHKLLVLQNESLKSDPEYYNYLSLYFTDETNGKGSYKMGRYMELRAPLADELVLNFNNTYNPYCAYSDRYSCPVPPKENHLSFPVEAGVKKGFYGGN